MVEPPDIVPVPRDEKRVFLAPEKWLAIDDVAAFHDEAYELLKIKQSVSRNDVVERFVDWALEQFWEAKGGRPKTAAERKKKVAEFAEEMKAKIEARKAQAERDLQSR